MNNLYQVLGLERSATPADIQRAYKEFATHYEPHRHANSPFFTDRFKEVMSAYEILSDPVRRQEYDAENRSVMEWKSRTQQIEAAWATARAGGEVKVGPPSAGRGTAGLVGFLLGAALALGAGWGYVYYVKPLTTSASAVAEGEQKVAPDPRPGALSARMNRLLDKESFVQAVQVADSALKQVPFADTSKLNPERGQGLFLRAIAKQSIKNDSGALRDYSAAIRVGGRGAAVFNNRGLLRQQTGDLLGAEQDFWLAVAVEPEAALFRLNLGSLQLDQKNFAQAEAQLRRATVAEPGNAEAWLLLGNARHELKQAVGACEAWKKGAELGLEPAIENAQLFCK
ncbi:MAG: DnaJ domain-containing protein [Hymenobacteraceae bacterium]|nr:DnaJ domain-containing protein [Hymenobacteraceae bacterium]